MIKSIIALLALVACRIDDVNHHGRRYVLFGEDEAVCHSDAIKICESYGGYLAKIDGNHEKEWLSHAISVNSYIDSWNGDSYGDDCIVLASGTEQIVIAQGNCDGPNGFVCEFDCEY